MATEIEMKLRVPDQEVLEKVLSDPELLQYTKDDYVTRHMTSTYYDTPDNLLHQRKWTLRLRGRVQNRQRQRRRRIFHPERVAVLCREH